MASKRGRTNPPRQASSGRGRGASSAAATSSTAAATTATTAAAAIQPPPPPLPNMPVDPDFGDVIFASHEQYDRFQSLKVRPIAPTKFFCHATLRELGLFDSVRALFTALGLESWFNMYHQTFSQLTLEFLSSLMPGKNRASESVLRFRINNVSRQVTLLQFCEILGLPLEYPPSSPPNNEFMYALWPKIAGVVPPALSQMYISDVQHPVLRLFLKFARECLFASPGNHLARSGDVNILLRILDPHPEATVSIPHLLWKHLNSVAINKTKSAIHVGGIITHIAAHFDFPDPSELGDTSVLMNKNHLRQSKFIFDDPHLLWRTTPNVTMPLPDPQLPTLVQGAPSYLLHGDPPALPTQPLEVPAPRLRIRSQRPPEAFETQDEGMAAGTSGETSAGPQGFYTPFQQQLLDGMGRIEIGMTHIRDDVADLRTRLTRLEDDHYRAAYPGYDFCYRSHMTPHDVPAPS